MYIYTPNFCLSIYITPMASKSFRRFLLIKNASLVFHRPSKAVHYLLPLTTPAPESLLWRFSVWVLKILYIIYLGLIMSTEIISLVRKAKLAYSANHTEYLSPNTTTQSLELAVLQDWIRFQVSYKILLKNKYVSSIMFKQSYLSL